MSLQIRGLSVVYGDQHAVRDASLTVSDGERFAIMGPSGSGKSTMLRAIAGLARMSSGMVNIDGVDMADTPAHQRSVGLMFQDYALFPHMTVADNVAYGLRMAGARPTERDARSRELLRLVGLEGFADRRPATLSGGEQQRVALARTLAPEPSIVLLDEPMGSLDVSLRETLLAETRNILDAVGATSIYVTHDRSEAFAFCDRMAIMAAGKIVRVGTPDEIWHDPQSEFVARAIGQSNLIRFSIIEPGRTGMAFVPPDAVTALTEGRLTGLVRTTRFEDGARYATLGLPDGISNLELRVPPDTPVGATIRFEVDPGRVIIVSIDEI